MKHSIAAVLLCALSLVAVVLSEGAQAQVSRTADLIVVLDSSGSMDETRNELQNRLNAAIGTIAAQQIDAHLIVITTAEFCLPAPVGNGSCSLDENLPNYRHVAVPVDSTQLFQTVLDQYGAFAGSLRSGATRDILFITDDNDAMTASTFDSQLIALDAGFAGYTAHAFVASATAPGCGVRGAEYLTLASQTSGVQSDLCASGIEVGVDSLVGQIIARFPPPPPPPPTPRRTAGKVTLHVGQLPEAGVMLNLNGQLVDLDPAGTYVVDLSLAGTQPTALHPTCSLSFGSISKSKSKSKYLDSRSTRGSSGSATWSCTLLKMGKKATLVVSLTVPDQPYGRTYVGSIVARRDGALLIDATVSGAAN